MRAALYAGAALVALALIVPLAALALEPRSGEAFLWSAAGAGLAIVLSGVIAGVILPFRRWRHDHQVARFVGQKHPGVASDLLSAVELGAMGAERAAQKGHVSADLVGALLHQTATRIEVIEPGSLVPAAPLKRAAAFLGCLAVVHGMVLLLLPASLKTGWDMVMTEQPAGPFGGAAMSSTPLVGDLHVTLAYPAYTRRPKLVLPSSSGDVSAMPGTLVTIETTALVPLRVARILIEQQGENKPGKSRAGDTASQARAHETEVHVELVDQRTLRAEFLVQSPARYRFLMETPVGQKLVESDTRQIEIEADRPPDVQLYTPGEEIDVTSLKRVELAYIVEDDYGLSRMDLVWEEKGKEQRKSLALPAEEARSAQGKFLWDLAEVSLEPGMQVSYFLEAVDNDTVLGPNVGRSREFRLRVFSPREKHEALIGRQRELFEKMLRALGGRLVASLEDAAVHAALQRESGEIVVELGTLVTALGADELADKALRTALDEMRVRLDKLVKAEAGLMARLAGPPPTRPVARLGAVNGEMVGELEDDVIRLADWLDRQQMENLLALGDELDVHKDRLRQLFKEYERTGSQELLAEIEREMRALEKRLAEMAEKRSDMAEDVLDQFVNSEAVKEHETQDCLSRVRALMGAGQMAEAQKTLEECMSSLDQANRALEQALGELRSDKFSESERKFAEVMDRLGDLTQDQRELAERADDIWNRYAERADEMMREGAHETQKRAERILERLKSQLDRVPESGLTPFAKEELEIMEARLRDVEEMLADSDIAEAMAMAEQAESSLETTVAELDAAMEEEADEPWSESLQDARRELARAQPLAAKLVKELESSTPAPSEIMSAEERRMLGRLGKQQQGMAERARKLVERAQQLAGELPGQAGDAISQGVEGARNHMERATERMGAEDPSGARQETRSAAEALERTLESGKGAARSRQAMGRAGLRDEPIRIPGADEYKAPEAFREDIMEAMKREQVPQGFGELVKRYYEELIR